MADYYHDAISEIVELGQQLSPSQIQSLLDEAIERVADRLCLTPRNGIVDHISIIFIPSSEQKLVDSKLRVWTSQPTARLAYVVGIKTKKRTEEKK